MLIFSLFSLLFLVVICFDFVDFAFKNCIFDIDKQRLAEHCLFYISCDLLSKIVSLTLINNLMKTNITDEQVVICFQKLYL